MLKNITAVFECDDCGGTWGHEIDPAIKTGEWSLFDVALDHLVRRSPDAVNGGEQFCEACVAKRDALKDDIIHSEPRRRCVQYYRCKCGDVTVYGSMPPSRCDWCEECQSNPASSPAGHRERVPHEWIVETVQTDNGDQPVTVCQWCGILKIKADAAREET